MDAGRRPRKPFCLSQYHPRTFERPAPEPGALLDDDGRAEFYHGPNQDPQHGPYILHLVVRESQTAGIEEGTRWISAWAELLVVVHTGGDVSMRKPRVVFPMIERTVSVHGPGYHEAIRAHLLDAARIADGARTQITTPSPADEA